MKRHVLLGIKDIWLAVSTLLLWVMYLSPIWVGYLGLCSLPGGRGPFGQSYIWAVPMIVYGVLGTLYAIGGVIREYWEE